MDWNASHSTALFSGLLIAYLIGRTLWFVLGRRRDQRIPRTQAALDQLLRQDRRRSVARPVDKSKRMGSASEIEPWNTGLSPQEEELAAIRWEMQEP